jgi:hypothetical protein
MPGAVTIIGWTRRSRTPGASASVAKSSRARDISEMDVRDSTFVEAGASDNSDLSPK